MALFAGLVYGSIGPVYLLMKFFILSFFLHPPIDPFWDQEVSREYCG